MGLIITFAQKQNFVSATFPRWAHVPNQLLRTAPGSRFLRRFQQADGGGTANPDPERNSLPRLTPGAQGAYFLHVGNPPRPPEPDPLGTRMRQSGANPLPDQGPFKFRDRAENLKEKPSLWRGGVHVLMQAHELDPERIEFAQRVHELFQRS